MGMKDYQTEKIRVKKLAKKTLLEIIESKFTTPEQKLKAIEILQVMGELCSAKTTVKMNE